MNLRMGFEVEDSVGSSTHGALWQTLSMSVYRVPSLLELDKGCTSTVGAARM